MGLLMSASFRDTQGWALASPKMDRLVPRSMLWLAKFQGEYRMLRTRLSELHTICTIFLLSLNFFKDNKKILSFFFSRHYFQVLHISIFFFSRHYFGRYFFKYFTPVSFSSPDTILALIFKWFTTVSFYSPETILSLFLSTSHHSDHKRYYEINIL